MTAKTQTRRSITLSVATYDAIDKIAIERNVGKSKVIEEMVNQYLDAQGVKHSPPPDEIEEAPTALEIEAWSSNSEIASSE